MAKKRPPQALETIDLAALQGVSGGRTSATAAKAGAGSSSARNSATPPLATSSDPMMQLLTQIEASLASMSQNQTQDPFMKAMMMMQMMNGNGGGGYRPR